MFNALYCIFFIKPVTIQPIMSIVCKVSRGVNQRFNSFFVISVYHPVFYIVSWTPFCLNVFGCLKCLYYNDHQMRKRFLLQMVWGWINKHKHSISNVSLFVLYHWMNSGNFYGSEIQHGIFSRGRHFLIWPIRVCAAEQGTVFKVLIWFWGTRERVVCSALWFYQSDESLIVISTRFLDSTKKSI